MEMIAVYGWCASWTGGEGKWGYEYLVSGGMGKDFRPNFLQPLLENINRTSCNDGSREYLVEVPS